MLQSTQSELNGRWNEKYIRAPKSGVEDGGTPAAGPLPFRQT